MMACDSVDAVYTTAMEAMGRDCSDIKGQDGVATAIWLAGLIQRPEAQAVL